MSGCKVSSEVRAKQDNAQSEGAKNEDTSDSLVALEILCVAFDSETPPFAGECDTSFALKANSADAVSEGAKK